MNILILAFLLLLISCGALRAQCPEGDVILNLQVQVNYFEFNWPDCDSIHGDLFIGLDDGTSNIHNLLALGNISYIQGTLHIGKNNLLETLHGFDNLNTVGEDLIVLQNETLQNFSGINNLRKIGNTLYLINNSSLENLEGLNNLSYIGKDLVVLENQVLINLDGLEQLDTIKNRASIMDNPLLSSIQALSDLDYLYELEFSGNDNITSLTGLEQAFIDNSIFIDENMGLTSLDGLGSLEDFSGSLLLVYNPIIQDYSVLSDLDSLYYLHLSGCDSLTDLQVLENLIFVEDWLSINSNPGLISLAGMSNLKHVGSLAIAGNNLLTNLVGLPEFKKIDNKLSILGNGLQSLEGLDSLVEVGGDFTVWFEDNLVNMNGLGSLSSVGQKLWLLENNQMEDLSGLEQLTAVGSILEIDFNDSLLNLVGLESLDSIGRWLWIRNNPSLSSLNGLESLQYVGEMLSIESNASLTDINALNHSITPLYHDIAISENELLSDCSVQAVCETLQTPGAYVSISNNNEGCENKPQVIQACLTNTSPGLEILPECVLSPNPVISLFKIQLDTNHEAVFRLRYPNGSLLIERIFIRDHQFDFAFLTPGVYFVEIQVDGQLIMKKIMKI
ncbi:MAG: hypothetical protein HUU01_06185 [Saprospiraceae bacterium]|nr:hypothetical protein [Saprospiraceae bacterium]